MNTPLPALLSISAQTSYNELKEADVDICPSTVTNTQQTVALNNTAEGVDVHTNIKTCKHTQLWTLVSVCTERKIQDVRDQLRKGRQVT